MKKKKICFIVHTREMSISLRDVFFSRKTVFSVYEMSILPSLLSIVQKKCIFFRQ